ncbi:hypothetical protein LTR37_006506 [Vermiconidia calcicola]|uniref:Uncharacterized protein n=1 Tax=Vermiconidia calcicola TaxID=1690605 RepID=A0ACC3NG09_9PEZI|nr:hypothetical protein LTR37_006506 [Vermiconidia calcicola]
MSNLVDKVKDKMDNKSGSSTGLSQGSKLPAVGALKEDNMEKGSIDLSLLKGKNIIVGVPGAFSPACSSQVPGFIEKADKFAAKGVQGIYIVAVNDVFTTQAWKEQLGSKNPMVHFLADDDAKFTKGAGMSFNASAFFGNDRSNRYAAVIENGIVKQVFQEEAPTDVKVSKADNVLQAIS